MRSKPVTSPVGNHPADALKSATDQRQDAVNIPGNKWEAEGISACKYDAERSCIDSVLAHPDYGDAIGTPSEYTRQNVIFLMRAGVAFVIISKDADGKWQRGLPVYLVTINGKEYLKTVDNKEEADQLAGCRSRP